MTSDPTRAVGDPGRLEALRRTGLLDTLPEEAFDRLTRLASRFLGAPVALFSLLERDRQFLKSVVGLPEPLASAREFPLSHSFCQYAVADAGPLVIEDAREHPLLRSNPAVPDFGVVAYAGFPLFTSDGHAVGTLCVVDHQPRRWTEDDLATLRDLAAAVTTEIELRRDVARRREAEAELRRERDFGLQVMSTMGQGLTVLDTEGRFVYVNPQFSRMTGRPPEALLGTPADALVHDGDHEQLHDARGRWRAGETVTYEARVLRADGSDFPALVTSAPRLHDGQVIGSIGVVSNLSQRKRLEEEQRRSERQFRLMIENASDVITLLDEHGVIRYESPSILRVLGYPPGELVGTAVFDLVHPDDRAGVLDAFARVVGTPGVPLSVELRFLHRDGSWRVLEATGASLLDDPAVGRVVVNSRDVTDRREADRALRRSEERFREVVENASDIIYRADLEGCFTYANPVAARIMGLPEEEILGKSYLELIRPDHREAARAFYKRQLVERIPNTYFEFPAVSGDGREVWIGQNVQLVLEGDRLAGVQAVARDITERREIDRMKDEFISIVSHELRTPLASMRGSLGLVASGLAGALDARGKRLLEIALQNTDRLVRLVNDILDAERLATGDLLVEPRPVDAADLVREAADAVREDAARAGVALEAEPVPLPLQADPGRVVQTLVSLLSNAVKFSPAGGTVRLETVPGEGEVRFRVVDQGPGVPPEQRDAVFQPFRQLDSSDARRTGGTGLGLAICRSIVRRHGGEIWVEDAPGGGSAFCFTLPLASPAPVPRGPDVAERTADLNP